MNDNIDPPSTDRVTSRVTECVAMVHVANVDLSVEFYSLLGFTCASNHCSADGSAFWAAISSGKARLFLTRASEPVIASQQAVLFYMYADNLAALRNYVLSRGLVDAGAPPSEPGVIRAEPMPDRNAVCEIRYPFYMPDGELRIHDLDGDVILVGKLGN